MLIFCIYNILGNIQSEAYNYDRASECVTVTVLQSDSLTKMGFFGHFDIFLVIFLGHEKDHLYLVPFFSTLLLMSQLDSPFHLSLYPCPTSLFRVADIHGSSRFYWMVLMMQLSDLSWNFDDDLNTVYKLHRFLCEEN